MRPLIFLCAITLFPSVGMADWSGAYGGFGLGAGSGDFAIDDGTTETSFDLSSGSHVSAYAGYLVQQGNLVFGGEISTGRFDGIDLQPDEFARSYTDIRGRVGTTFDNIFAYGVAGFSLTNFRDVIADTDGSDLVRDLDGTGFNYGAGVDYLINDRLFVGIEYIARSSKGDVPDDPTFVSDVESTFSLDVSTISIRTGFQF